ncbi:hypothetical protein [Arenimonas metalli]|uniref:Uncharacterized protein n=1 Tax=Arenimonas metalli CF5-1 TaxID=1384056 RepID=A0A091BAN2_9GAMM|nr:hypothetical protein [Arenimonas metalli]KFN47884.1 hypothetical protein N787_07395 [Arenimonas metalli CF5-1]
MGTIEMRGVLAVALIASSGLLTGMAALPAGLEVAQGGEGEGLFKRVMHRACLVSVAATRSDLRSAADRERECR